MSRILLTNLESGNQQINSLSRSDLAATIGGASVCHTRSKKVRKRLPNGRIVFATVKEKHCVSVKVPVKVPKLF